MITTVLQAIRVFTFAIVAFLLALSLTPTLLDFLKRINARKQIRSSEAAPIYSRLHANKAGTPTMGGVIIWGTVIVLALVFAILNLLFNGFFKYLNFIDRAQTYLPLAALLIAAILGLADDIVGILKIGPKGGGLTVQYKLLVYFVLSAIGAWWFYYRLGWNTLYIPFVGNVAIGLWYIPIFIFVVVATAFSANETDGLDGLLGGVSLFAFGALTTVAFVLGRYDLAVMGGTMGGALLAFLWFNIHPAKLFMGDTGSMAIGITLGIMALLTNTALFLPLFAFIMVIESLSVIIQLISKRLFKHKIFLSTPIHHHFEALGWPEYQVTMRFWIISVVFAGLGLIVFFLARIL
ncbi:MAG: phospho-N-acetylmuramoyl-pentapeptide-transferase [Patescibacteria group bacterium]|nr:phospho-N-acetylmuramoyl-pentapeptide-transferase [Patescibacteria group bacterium]MCL5224198.1 phospho-N-acetylmuramoyl-pentapeptide-transferase [Patescibacteria group bacterium]